MDQTINQDRAKSLFSALDKDNWDVGTEQDFLENIKDPKKAEALFMAIKDEYEVGNSLEEFYAGLSGADPINPATDSGEVGQQDENLFRSEPNVPYGIESGQNGFQSEALRMPEMGPIDLGVDESSLIPGMPVDRGLTVESRAASLEKTRAENEYKNKVKMAREWTRNRAIDRAQPYLAMSGQNLFFADEQTRLENIRDLVKMGMTEADAFNALRKYDNIKLAKIGDEYIADRTSEIQKRMPNNSPEAVSTALIAEAKADAVMEMDEKEQELYKMIDDVTKLSVKNMKEPNAADQVKIAALKKSISQIKKSALTLYDPLTGSRLTQPTAESMEFNNRVGAEEARLKKTFGDQLADIYLKRWSRYKAVSELYDDHQRMMSVQVANADPSIQKQIGIAERTKQIYIDAKAEFEAAKRAYMFNEDFGYVNREPGKLLLDAFKDEVLPQAFFPEGVRLAKNQEFVDKIGQIFNDNRIEFTSSQKDRAEHTVGDMAAEGVGGMLGIIPKLYVAGAIIGEGASAIGLAKNISRLKQGSALDRLAAWTLDGVLEEAKTQSVGMEPGMGIGFKLADGIKVPNLPGRIGAIMQPFVQKMFSGTIGGTVGMEAGTYISAAAKALEEDKGFQEKVKELGLDDGTENGKRILSELIVNSLFGMYHAVNTKGAFIKDPKQLQRLADELESKGLPTEADQLRVKAQQISGEIASFKEVKTEKVESNEQVETVDAEDVGKVNLADYRFEVDGKVVDGQDFLDQYNSDKDFRDRVNSGETTFVVRDANNIQVEPGSVLQYIKTEKKETSGAESQTNAEDGAGTKTEPDPKQPEPPSGPEPKTPESPKTPDQEPPVVDAIDREEVVRAMEPYARKMVDIERQFSNRGLKIETGYDNEVLVTDSKTGDIVDPADVPDDLKDAAMNYEAAASRLGEYDDGARESALAKAREVEDAPVEVVEPQGNVIQSDQKGGELTQYEKERSAGTKVVAGNTYTRQPKLSKVAVGNRVGLVWSKKDKTEASYAVIERKSLQPSHKSGVQNPMHFIPEAQPRDRGSMEVLKNEAKKKSDNLDPEQLGVSPSPYVGAPVVNERGEVIQGNGRAEAIDYYYQNRPEDPNGYKEFLRQSATSVGIDPGLIDEFDEPVLVRLQKGDDAEAIRLGNFTSKDTEDVNQSGSAEKALVNRMTSTQVDAVADLLLAKDDGEMSLKDLLRKSGAAVIKRMQEIGVLRDDAGEVYIDNDGLINDAGREMLSQVFKGMMFKGGDVNLPTMFANLPDIIQKGLEKSVVNILRLPTDKSILPELQNVMAALYDLRKFREANGGANVPVESWSKTGDAFSPMPSEILSPFELAMVKMIDDAKTQKAVSKIINDYVQETRDRPGDMFEPAVKGSSKEDAIKKLTGVDYGKTQNRPRGQEDVPEPGQQAAQPAPAETANDKGTDPEAIVSQAETAAESSKPLPEDTPEQVGRKIDEVERALDDVNAQLEIVQEYGGISEIPHESPNVIIARKAKADMTTFSKELAKALGFEHDTRSSNRTTTPVYANANIARAGGDVSIYLWRPGRESGVAIYAEYEEDREGRDAYVLKSVMYRNYTWENQHRGMQNHWFDGKPTVAALAEAIRKISGEIKQATAPGPESGEVKPKTPETNEGQDQKEKGQEKLLTPEQRPEVEPGGTQGGGTTPPPPPPSGSGPEKAADAGETESGGERRRRFREKAEKISDDLKKDIDDLLDDLGGKLGANPMLNPEYLAKAMNIVRKLLQAGLYRFADILDAIYEKYGEQVVRTLFSYLKNSYSMMRDELDDAITDQMDSGKEFKTFDLESYLREARQAHGNQQPAKPETERVRTGATEVRQGEPQQPLQGPGKVGETDGVAPAAPGPDGGGLRKREEGGTEPGPGDGVRVEPIYGNPGGSGSGHNDDVNRDLGGDTDTSQPDPEPGKGVISHPRIGGNFVIPPDFIHAKTFNVGQNLSNNINALRTILKIREERRLATAEEQDILFKYVGWGGLKMILLDPEKDAEWGVTDSKYREQIRDVHKIMQELYGEDGKKAAIDSFKQNVLNAHFTDISVIRGIYNVLDKMGFGGGKVIEPAAGVGHFIGAMPERMASASDFTAVEIEPITADILSNLYQGVSVQNSPYEKAKLPENYYDLAVSNVPFGNYGVFDKAFLTDKRKAAAAASIHNYFFAKAIDHVRPGGLIAFVTSRWTLDSQKAVPVREYLAEKAEFVGAIRLPDHAFAGNANTEVVADIVFMRKYDEGEKPNKGQSEFIGKSVQPVIIDGENYTISPYFQANPDHVIGKFEKGMMNRAGDLTVKADKGISLEQSIADIGSKFAKRFAKPAAASNKNPEKPQPELIPKTERPGGLSGRAKVGSIITRDGNVYRVRSEKYGPDGEKEYDYDVVAESNQKLADAVRKYSDVRDRLLDQFDLERSDVSDDEVEKGRARLRKAYHDFVSRHGNVNKRGNIQTFIDDADWYSISALESYNKDKKVWEPADILNKRALAKQAELDRVDTAAEAMTASMATYGKIDPEWMASIYGKNWEEIVDELGDNIFELPQGGWEPADKYLSGELGGKIRDAEKALEMSPRFQKNVDALRQALPRPLNSAEVVVQIGARWVPISIYTDFVRERFSDNTFEMSYDRVSDEYKILRSSRSEQSELLRVKNRNGYDIVIEALHGRFPTVTYTDLDGKTYTDEAATETLKERIEAIGQEFENWVFKTQERRDRVLALYNDKFNSTVLRRYDGSHLTFPGMSSDLHRLFAQHQKDAVWMTTQNRGGVVDHIVGAGKTWVIAAQAMEMRRLGLARRPVIAALKANVASIVGDIKRLYPAAKILFPRVKDFEKANRPALFTKMMTNDYDVIIVTHDNLKKMPNDPAIEQEIVQQEIDELRALVDTLEGDPKEVKKQLKRIEKRIKSLEAKLEESISKQQDQVDKVPNWAELGIDHVIVDESQQFKNLPFSTKLSGVAGLGTPKGSGRAFDLMMKIRDIQKRTNSELGATFYSGTVISNSISELYLIMKYMRPKMLRSLGLETFDAWARTFARHTSELEINAGGDFKMKDRFRTIINAPELSRMYREFADIRNDDNLKIDKPKEVSDLVIVEQDEQQQKVFKALLDFYQSKGKDIGGLLDLGIKVSENAAKSFGLVTTDLASKASLDPRLLNPQRFQYNPDGKIGKVVSEIVSEYRGSDQYKGIQLVFCDLGVPKSGNEKQDLFNYLQDGAGMDGSTLEYIYGEGYNSEDAYKKLKPHEVWGRVQAYLMEEGGAEPEDAAAEIMKMQASYEEFYQFDIYNDIRNKLVLAGIPKHEIEFIHDHNTAVKKESLFDAARKGNVRVIIGSTEKLGTGVNVQKRLVRLHNMDMKWRPSDMQQRAGRLIRQGAELVKEHYGNEGRITNYATKDSFDPYRYNLVRTKQRLIMDFQAGAIGKREITEGDDDAMAEWIAAMSGNPKILERAKLERRIKKLTDSKKVFDQQRYEAEEFLKKYDTQVEAQKKLIESLRLDAELYRENTPVQEDIEDAATGPGVQAGMFDTGIETAEVKPSPQQPDQPKQEAKNTPPKVDITIRGKHYDKPLNAGQQIMIINEELSHLKTPKKEVVGNYKGFDIVAEKVAGQAPKWYLIGPGRIQHFSASGMLYSDPVKNGKFWFENALKGLDDRWGFAERALVSANEKKAVYEDLLTKTWGKDEELGQAVKEKEAIDTEFKEQEKAKEQIRKQKAESSRDVDNELESGEENDIEPAGSEKSSSGGFEDVTTPESTKNTRPDLSDADNITPIEFPELVEIAKELMGRYPKVKAMQARGKFVHVGSESWMLIHPKLFVDGQEVQLAKTIAHEIGHLWDWLPDHDLKRGNLVGRLYSLHKFMSGVFGTDSVKNSEYRKELFDLSKLWRPMPANPSGSYEKYRKSSKEIYADAISVLLNNPKLFKDQAPKSYTTFFSELDRKPEVRDIYFDIVSRYSDREKVLDERSRIRREGFAKGKERLEQLAERERKREAFTATMRRQLVSKYAPILSRLDDPDHLGYTLTPDMKVRNALESMSFYRNDIYVLTSQIKRDIIDPVFDAGMDMEDLGELLSYQSDFGARADIANPGGIQSVTAQEMISRMERKLGPEKWAVLRDAAQKFHDVVFNLATRYYESGGISEKTYNEVIVPNANYYSTRAIVDYIDSFHIPAAIIKARGTLKESANPIHATIMKAASMSRSIIRQDAINQFREYWEKSFPDEISPSVPIRDANGNIRGFRSKTVDGHRWSRIEYMVDGKRAGIDVEDARIAEAFEKMAFEDVFALIKLLKPVLKVFKGVVTQYNPAFAFVMNPIRDGVRTFKNTMTILSSTGGAKLALKGIPVGMAEYVKSIPTSFNLAIGGPQKYLRALEIPFRFFGGDAVVDRLRKGAWKGIIDWDAKQRAVIEEMLANKALEMQSFYFSDYDPNANDGMQPLLKEFGITEREDKNRNVLKKVATGMVEAILSPIRIGGSVFEFNSKIAGYRTFERLIKNPELSAYYTRNWVGTPNRAEHGTWTSTTNDVFVFSNVIIQGMRADANLARKPATRGSYWLFTMLQNVIPAILVGAAAAGVMGPHIKMLYDQIPEYDKVNYLCVVVGQDALTGATKYLRIPIDDFGRVIHGMVYKVASAKKEGGIKKPIDLLKLPANSIPSLAPTYEILNAWFDYGVNDQNPQDSRFGKNVISDYAYREHSWRAVNELARWSVQKFGITYRKFDPTKESYDEWITRRGTMNPIDLIKYAVLKSSQQGVMDVYRDLLKDIDKKRVGEILDQQEYVKTKAVEIMQELGGVESFDPKLQDLVPVLKKKKRELRQFFGDGKLSPEQSNDVARMQDLLETYVARGISGADSGFLELVIYADTDKKRREFLKSFRDQYGEARYNKLTETMRRLGVYNAPRKLE